MPTGDVAVALQASSAGFLQDGGGGGVGGGGVGATLGRVASPEVKSGSLILIGPGKNAQHVQVKVYRTSLEHFAVVFPQKKVCRPLGFVNLRHTVVARLPAAGERVQVKTLLGAGGAAGAAGAGPRSKEMRCPSVSLPRQYQHLAGVAVRSRQCDSPHTLTFLCENPKELESWLSVLDPARRESIVVDTLREQPILEEGDEL